MHKTTRMTLALAGTVVALAVSGTAAFAAPLPTGWTSVGNSGTNTAADGDVTLAPGFDSYQWISTYNGLSGVGLLPVGATGQETNGSFAQTPTFSVNAGDKLNFYFNYITSDGAQYTEYAWAGLFSGVSTFDSYLLLHGQPLLATRCRDLNCPGLPAALPSLQRRRQLSLGLQIFRCWVRAPAPVIATAVAIPAGSRWNTPSRRQAFTRWASA